MKKLFVYGGVFLLLMHHFFIWTFVLADEYSVDDAILSMEIVEEVTQEQDSDQTIEPEELEEGIVEEEFLMDDDLGDIDDGTEETEDDIVYIIQESSSEEISFPQVLITEVAFAGSQEWFELYNPYDIVFVGTLDVTGVRSSMLTLQNITIPAKTAIIIARSQGLEIIADTGVVHSIQTLSMPDTTPLHITLSIDGEIVDTFSASVSLMNQANKSTNDRSSLQRTLDDISVVRLSPPSQNYNTSDPAKYKINPGIVYQSLSDTPPAACEKYGQIVQIREIFRGDTDRDPYIELFIPGHMTQELTIGGTILDDSFTIFVDQPAGHYHLISIPGNSYTEQPFVSDNQKLSFRSGLGNLHIYGQGGQVLDKVDISVREVGYSSYVSGQGCQRVANQVDVYSPRFPRSYFSYFPEGVEKVVPVVETIVIPAEPDYCEQSEEMNTGIIPDNIATTPRTGAPITIAHISYQGPSTGKSITLSMTGGDPIALSDFYILTNSTNKRNLRDILQPDIPLTLTGSLGFAATQARCVQLFHKDYPNTPIDTYCYDPLEDAKRKGEIKITNIVYETPTGSTTRKLHLHVPEGIVDLSKNRYIMINTTKRNLTSYGLISGHVVLEGTFPFPKTTATCVDLRQYDVLFDRYCYTPPQSISNTNQNATPFDTQRLSYPIKITHINYAGPTTGKSMTLFMTGGSPVDMSHFHILINGTTKRNLKGILEPNKPLTITGSLGFAATQARCVELFHKEYLFDTYCYDPAEDRAREQAARIWTGDIIISDISYETDESHPDQSLTLSTTGADIIFAHGRYLMINTRKFNLSSFGTGNGDIVLTGNFRFPKTVTSCVTIGQYDREFTTYCYDPKAKKETDKKDALLYSGVHLEILAALPNPRGADAGKERIDLILHTPDTVDFSQGFSLLINGRTKRAISGNPIAGEVYRLTGTFVLPNAASCFSILYQDDILDTFCYPQTKEGIIYNKNSQTLLALTDAELGLLNATKLTRFDNRLCLTLSDVMIKCRTIPAGKLAARQMEELKLSRNYITTLHDYLYNHRQIIYFNTDIIHYKTIFDQSKKEISSSQFTWRYGSERIPVSDIQTRFQLQYQQPLLQTVQSQVSKSLFGPKLASNYQKAKEQRYRK